MTETPQIRSLDAADESRALELGRIDLIEPGGLAFDRGTGAELVASAGDVYLIPTGHDSWVVGDEPCVALDLRPTQ